MQSPIFGVNDVVRIKGRELALEMRVVKVRVGEKVTTYDCEWPVPLNNQLDRRKFYSNQLELVRQAPTCEFCEQTISGGSRCSACSLVAGGLQRFVELPKGAEHVRNLLIPEIKFHAGEAVEHEKIAGRFTVIKELPDGFVLCVLNESGVDRQFYGEHLRKIKFQPGDLVKTARGQVVRVETVGNVLISCRTKGGDKVQYTSAYLTLVKRFKKGDKVLEVLTVSDVRPTGIIVCTYPNGAQVYKWAEDVCE